MVIEGIIIAGTLSYICIKEYSDRTAYKDRKYILEKMNSVFRGIGTKNKEDKMFVCSKVFKTDYGYSCYVNIPDGLNHSQIEDCETTIKSNFGIDTIEFVKDSNQMIVKLITNILQVGDYEPIKCGPHELYVGYDVLNHVKVNMAESPHSLITGGSGTGKSRLLFIMLCNLLQREDIEMYLGQVAKKELNIFNKCKQVKYVATDLDKLHKMLKHIDKERVYREKIIGDLADKGVFNIDDYNSYTKKKLKVLYVVLDELAFIMPTKIDNKQLREKKLSCLITILELLRAGRSSGIYVISCLQQPDKESLPAWLKRLFQCLLCFKQPTKQASELVIGNDVLSKIGKRDLIVLTNEFKKCKTPNIDFDIIRKYIANSIEENHEFIHLGKELDIHESEEDLQEKFEKAINNGEVEE